MEGISKTERDRVVTGATHVAGTLHRRKREKTNIDTPYYGDILCKIPPGNDGEC